MIHIRPSSTAELPTHLVRERALIKAWQEEADEAALSELLREGLPRLKATARRMSPELADDLLAEGLLALMKAAKRYVPQGDTPFIAYGVAMARFAMIAAKIRLQSMLTVPQRHLRDVMAGRRQDDELEAVIQGWGQGEPLDDAHLPLAVAAAEEETLQREKRAQSRRAVAQALRLLNHDERCLVVAYRLQERRDLSALTRRLGLSPDRARQIEARALMKMRHSLLSRGFAIEDLTV